MVTLPLCHLAEYPSTTLGRHILMCVPAGEGRGKWGGIREAAALQLLLGSNRAASLCFAGGRQRLRNLQGVKTAHAVTLFYRYFTRNASHFLAPGAERGNLWRRAGGEDAGEAKLRRGQRGNCLPPGRPLQHADTKICIKFRISRGIFLCVSIKMQG